MSGIPKKYYIIFRLDEIYSPASQLSAGEDTLPLLGTYLLCLTALRAKYNKVNAKEVWADEELVARIRSISGDEKKFNQMVELLVSKGVLVGTKERWGDLHWGAHQPDGQNLAVKKSRENQRTLSGGHKDSDKSIEYTDV
ncbi:MAG: hypothetical protein QME51_04360 [Planctomycetota bacterium]|nr:hypothetical protein [Planctomycetota bacterium]